MQKRFNIQFQPLSLWNKKISSRFTPQVRALLLKDNFFVPQRYEHFFNLQWISRKNFKNTLAILGFASDTYNNEKPDKNYYCTTPYGVEWGGGNAFFYQYYIPIGTLLLRSIYKNIFIDYFWTSTKVARRQSGTDWI